MIRLVVFDMAGTTVDEDNVVYKTLQKAINGGGFPVDLDFVLQHGAGKEKLQAVRDIIMAQSGTVNEQEAQDIHTQFRTLLEKAYQELDVQPVTGAEQVFSRLKQHQVKSALNTGYDRNTALLLLEKLGWKEGVTIDAVVTASDVGKNRPDPDMILKLMEITGITDPEEVIKVGDSAIDIEEGKNAGCLLSIGITGGAQTATQLLEASPDYVITDLEDIVSIVIKYNS